MAETMSFLLRGAPARLADEQRDGGDGEGALSALLAKRRRGDFVSGREMAEKVDALVAEKRRAHGLDD